MKKVILKNQNSRTLSRAGHRLCERTKFFVTDGVKKQTMDKRLGSLGEMIKTILFNNEGKNMKKTFKGS